MNIGFGELIMILLVAFLVVGPKDLPKVARWLGRQVRMIRRMIEELKKETGWDDMEREINQTAEEIKQTAKRIYRALGCAGFARVDLFLTPSGHLVFNEVNTIPGFTEHSRYPGMMKAAGYSLADVLDRIIEQAVAQ